MADVTLNFFEDNRQGWGAGGEMEGGLWGALRNATKKTQIVTNDIYKLKKALFTDASRALC